VRKKNGQLEKVTLQKRKLENDENIVKSFVLKGAKNIGYITLPSFYTRWEDEGGSKCAYDVAKEIVKLKRDSITGLILDLRYNGGGSMQEAIEMAGIFIDEGAICQFNEKGEKLVTLKDINRGVIYNGPLVILVNGYSASASELLAASLQDYNRALIVGSRTHGKGTSQQIYPLENKAATVISSSGNAFVKLTGGKFYRVTGKSSQFYGVLPDIQIANPFDELGDYESKIPFALKPDTVGSYKYFKPMKELPKNGLQEKSTLRVSGNSKFKSIQMQAQQIRQERGGKTLLTWEAVEKRIKEGYGFGQAKPESSAGYMVLNNNADGKFFATNDVAKDINKSWRERIAADPYIEESFFILLDLINQNK
jgi:carboxyl-terminal processing protease